MTTPFRTIAICDPALDPATLELRDPEWGELGWASASREIERALLVPGVAPTVFTLGDIGHRAWREYVQAAPSSMESIWRAFEVGVVAIERPGQPVAKPSAHKPFRRWTEEDLEKLGITPAELDDIGSLAWTRGHLGKARPARWPLSPSWASVWMERTATSRPAAETASEPPTSSDPP